MNPCLALARTLISRPSVTPYDQGCQDLLRQRLEPLGFEAKTWFFDDADYPVNNIWLIKRGQLAQNLFVFLGHTDVVPPGDEKLWRFPPFSATVADGKLYGRGAADMKGAVAAFVVAVEEFLNQHPDHQQSLAFLLTSDEEKKAENGTVRVCEWLQEQQQKPTYCLVGEATSIQKLGDVVKCGRRGSLSASLCIHGVQGHIAYPAEALNPIQKALPALQEMAQMVWDEGNECFTASNFQICDIHAGLGVGNVIPQELRVDFNFRFCPESTAVTLQNKVEDILRRHQCRYDISWRLNSEPFWSQPGKLAHAVSDAIAEECHYHPQYTTDGGTSDGRFMAKICDQVLELGVLRATIHQVNECVDIDMLTSLKNIYRRVLVKLVR